MNPFENFVPQEQQPRNLTLLEAGVHHVKIERVIITDDQSLINGEPINNVEKKRCWSDVNPVLYLYLIADGGVFHYRFYWNGYMKWADAMKNPKYNSRMDLYRMPYAAGTRPYLIEKETNCRVRDEEASIYCLQLIQEFATATGCVGKNPADWVGHELYIELIDKWADGGRYKKLLQVSDKPIKPRQVNRGPAPQAISLSAADLDKTWQI